MPDKRQIAYFSMEIALDPRVPTYSGGLGVLAGDTIRAAADLKVPFVAVTLLYRRGCFTQRLDTDGTQRELPVEWPVEAFLKELAPRVSVTIEGRPVRLRVWQYEVRGVGGYVVPVYLLDADLPGNTEQDRALTHVLYGGDQRYRFCQEIILGMGGVQMLRALGHQQIQRFHMNEGHASLLTLTLLDEQAERAGRWAAGSEEVERVRQQCVFTTHTPVPAGHDQFPIELVDRVLGRQEIAAMPEVFCSNGHLDLTSLALKLSRYVNGVAKKHGETSRRMFDSETIEAITNGVHAATWVAPSFQELFDRHIPQWREDSFSLRHAMTIPSAQIWQAHTAAKQRLLDRVKRQTGVQMDAEVLTIGFARRAAAYKRGDLLFHDLARLRSIIERAGRIQLVYAGKAHPQDAMGKELITRIFQAKAALQPTIHVVYLEDYDMELGGILTGGADVWLNTPLPPLEASGTSGMKAALNGVPSLSVLDGWWVEGHIEGVTGWAIGEAARGPEATEERTPRDAASLYEQLEQVIIPLFYRQRERFIEVMRQTIALNGSFFHTQRMVQEYVLHAYFRR